MRKIDVAFFKLAQTNKVRIAKSICGQIFSKLDLEKINNGTLNVALGLMAKGNENCAGDEIIIGDLFGTAPMAPVAEEPAVEPESVVEQEPEEEPDDKENKWSNNSKKKSVIGSLWDTIKKMVEEE